jgi:hypothetical protein
MEYRYPGSNFRRPPHWVDNRIPPDHQAAALDADIMVWPSMMHTPDPFSYGYARIHQYHFIAVGIGLGRIIASFYCSSTL